MDKLNRAARAAYEAKGRRRYPWDDIEEWDRENWRNETAAALRVMADDVRALHRYGRADGRGTPQHCVYCSGLVGSNWVKWPCDTARTLEPYVGSDGEGQP